MVVVGLVLGVIVAVIVAAQGCGGSKRTRHAGGGGAPAAGVAASGGGSAAAAKGGPAATRGHGAGRRSAGARPHPLRRPDSHGPFFGFGNGHMARVDAPRRRAVAITFDDGPGPETPRILGELRALHARATFFVVGSMAAIRPDVVRAEQRAGMEIGNHTWTHPVMPQLTPSAQRIEIQRTNALLRQLTGRRPRFVRPPDGRVGEDTARVVEREQMIGVLRTTDTRDWTLPGTRTIVRRALSVSPGGIVALHDAGGYTRAQTAAAVSPIVRGLRRRHLRLVTISQLYSGGT